MPWWIRKYLRQVFKVDVSTAASRRKYWSFAYLATCFAAFNYVLIDPKRKDEEDELLTEVEKVMIRMNIQGAHHMKVNVGGETVTSEIRMDQLKESLEERKAQRLIAKQASSDGDTLQD